MTIYCDNAAQKPLRTEVADEIRYWLDRGIYNPSAIYHKARECKRELERARETVAKAIGASPNEIFFTSGATEGINWFCNEDKEYLLTTPIEHKAVLNNVAKNNYIPVDENGRIILDRFRDIVTSIKGAFSVVIGWVNNEIGTIQPIEEIVDICQVARACLCVDATQAIGMIPIDVHKMGIKCLVGSFHKCGGLAGSGFIYIKEGSYIEPLIKGGGQERGMRAGTENFLGIMAGAKAIELATKNIDIKAWQLSQIRDKIISGLLKIPHSYLNGGLDNRICNNINISFAGIEGESLVLNLDVAGIMASSGSACNSLRIQPSHVLVATGSNAELARGTLRLTIGEMTDEEVNHIITTVTDTVSELRECSPKWKELNHENN